MYCVSAALYASLVDHESIGQGVLKSRYDF